MSLGSQITVHQYEDWARDLVITEDGSPYDLSNVTSVRFTVRECFEDASPQIDKVFNSFTTPTAGIVNLTLTPTDSDITPGDYVWDIKLFFSNGTQHIPEELPGDFVVLNAVTQETS